MLSFRRALVLQLLLPAQRFRKDVLIVARALSREREKENTVKSNYTLYFYINIVPTTLKSTGVL